MKRGFEALKDPQYPYINVFKHPLFRKGDWEGCLQIKLPGSNGVIAQSSHAVATRFMTSSNILLSANLPSQEVDVEERNTLTLSPNARSVTPPKASSNVNLLERLASTQSGNTEPTSILGVMLSMPTNKNRRVTQDSTQDEAAASLQQNLRDFFSLGTSRGRMGSFSAQTLGSRSSLPMTHRRASLNDIKIADRIQLDKFRRSSLCEIGEIPSTFRSSFQVHQPRDRPVHTTSRILSDAEVFSVTEDIVSAAIDALHPKRRRIAIGHSPISSTSCLDVMTELFLQRSTKVLHSRPISIMGPRITTLRRNMISSTVHHQELPDRYSQLRGI